jgi:hypothetical protein
MHGTSNYLCITLGDSIAVVDIADPTAPALAATIPIKANQIYAGTRHAYVASDSGLFILDMSTITQPKIISFLNLRESKTVTFFQNMIYVGQQDVASWSFGVRIVDVTDRANPVIKGFAETSIKHDHSTFMKNPSHILIYKNYAYVGTMGGPHVFVIDISNADLPAEAGRFDLTDEEFADIIDMQISASNLYLACADNTRGFYQLKLKDPVQPQLGVQLQEPMNVRHIAVAGDILYVSSIERLWIYEFTNPESCTLKGSSEQWSNLYRIAINGHTLYGIRDNIFYILDVSDPQNIGETGHYECADGPIVKFGLHGSSAFLFTLAQSPSHMVVVDLSDPAHPASIANEIINGQVIDVAFADNDSIMYLGYGNWDGDNGLMSYNIAIPAKPVFLDSIKIHGVPIKIAVQDTVAIVSTVVIPTNFAMTQSGQADSFRR